MRVMAELSNYTAFDIHANNTHAHPASSQDCGRNNMGLGLLLQQFGICWVWRVNVDGVFQRHTVAFSVAEVPSEAQLAN